jgi:hypothetical protein
VIGACYDGPLGVDLRQDGPHALIAGTTGAGKSELLQTLIASLACANRPDEMTFVLVDYKGGSAFSGCVHLPHVTGLVTDLDAHLTQRALASLSAELTRREKVLAAAGAKDIEQYAERGHRQPRHRPLPRLMIVIDEFASLVRDLIITRAAGRSLALVLAGDPDTLASGFGGWQADARRARRSVRRRRSATSPGCLHRPACDHRPMMPWPSVTDS